MFITDKHDRNLNILLLYLRNDIRSMDKLFNKGNNFGVPIHRLIMLKILISVLISMQHRKILEYLLEFACTHDLVLLLLLLLLFI